MARQIQIRRGTAAEHEHFTGAEGEVTMDLSLKTLRVHDGETVGGTLLAKKSDVPDINNMDYVVEWQSPTADNNYTWYRKYKSGWIEQGGHSTITSKTVKTIAFQISFLSVPTISVSAQRSDGTAWVFIRTIPTTTGFSFGLHGTGEYATSSYVSWQACGICSN